MKRYRAFGGVSAAVRCTLPTPSFSSPSTCCCFLLLLELPRTATSTSSVDWPIDSAVLPGTPLAPAGGAVPMTRAKARWLMNQGAADNEAATCAIQTSPTWQMACKVVSQLARQEDSTVLGGGSGSSSCSIGIAAAGEKFLLSEHHQQTVNMSLVIESLSSRLLQERRTVAPPRIGGIDSVLRLDIVETLNMAAAEAVDMRATPGSWIPNEASDGGGGGDGANDTHDNDNDEQPFSVALAKSNAGTLGQHHAEAVVKRMLDFCYERHIPVSPAVLNNASLLTSNWVSALMLMRQADKVLETGAPVQVITNAMRCCVESLQFLRQRKQHGATFAASDNSSKQPANASSSPANAAETGTSHYHDDVLVQSAAATGWAKALQLYLLASRRFEGACVDTSRVTYAFHALTKYQRSRVIAASASVVGLNSASSSSSLLSSSSSLAKDEKSQWQWTLRLHRDANAAIAADPFWLRGEAGANVASAACVSAAMANNWRLALRTLSHVLDTQHGSLVDEELVTGSRALVVPDADCLFMGAACCAAHGRNGEASEIMRIFSGLGYTGVHVSGLLLMTAVRMAFSRQDNEAFAHRIFAPAMEGMMRRPGGRGRWTNLHCRGAAYFAADSLRKSQVKTMWQLAATAFAEYIDINIELSTQFVTSVALGTLSNAECTLRMMEILSRNEAKDAKILKALPLIASNFHALEPGHSQTALKLAFRFFASSSSSSSAAAAPPISAGSSIRQSENAAVVARTVANVMTALTTDRAHWLFAFQLMKGYVNYQQQEQNDNGRDGNGGSRGVGSSAPAADSTVPWSVTRALLHSVVLRKRAGAEHIMDDRSPHTQQQQQQRQQQQQQQQGHAPPSNIWYEVLRLYLDLIQSSSVHNEQQLMALRQSPKFVLTHARTMKFLSDFHPADDVEKMMNPFFRRIAATPPSVNQGGDDNVASNSSAPSARGNNKSPTTTGKKTKKKKKATTSSASSRSAEEQQSQRPKRGSIKHASTVFDRTFF